MLKRYFFTGFSFLWLGLITVLSLIDQKTTDVPTSGGGYSENITMPPSLIKVIVAVGFDSIFHSLAYAVAGVLFMLFLWERYRESITLRRAMILTFGLLCVYGIILEVLQVNFTNRTGEFSDAVSNTLGVGIGVLLIGLVFKRVSILNWHN